MTGLFTDDATPGLPYWWQDIEWPVLDAPPPEKVDLLVIGAGYTGLSAAIAAYDAGAQVAVIDAGQPGQGASTRNGGMVGAHPRLGWDALAKAYGSATADSIFAEAEPALRWVQELIKREKIGCDYQQTGRIQLAYTEGHAQSQRALAASIAAKSAARCNVVTEDGLHAEIATDLYRGALLFPGHAALHPAKYHAGLLDAVLRRNILVSANCAASSLNHEAIGYKIETPKGTIRAEKVILATNGYTAKPFDWFVARVFPLPSYLIATEKLSPDQIAKLAPGGRMMVETRARHSYFRISPDGTRILYGGRASMVNVDLQVAAKRLRATMAEV